MNKYTLNWDDELHNIGIGSLDNQHRKIVKLVNQIADTIAQGPVSGALDPLVEELLRTTQTHFVFEEALMEKHGYPNLSGHIAEHRELLRQLGNLQEDIVGSKRERAGLISAFLCDWTEIHILKSDKVLGDFLVEKGLS